MYKLHYLKLVRRRECVSKDLSSAPLLPLRGGKGSELEGGAWRGGRGGDAGCSGGVSPGKAGAGQLALCAGELDTKFPRSERLQVL